MRDSAQNAVHRLLAACDRAGLVDPVDRVRAIAHALVRAGVWAGLVERLPTTIFFEPAEDHLEAKRWHDNGSVPLVAAGSWLISPFHGLGQWDDVLGWCHAPAQPESDSTVMWATAWQTSPLWAQTQQDWPAPLGKCRVLRTGDFHPLDRALEQVVALDPRGAQAVRAVCGAVDADQALAGELEAMVWAAGGGNWLGRGVAALRTAVAHLNVHHHLPVELALHKRHEKLGPGQWAQRQFFRLASPDHPGFSLDLTLAHGPQAVRFFGHAEAWDPGKRFVDHVVPMSLFDPVASGQQAMELRALVERLRGLYLACGGRPLARRPGTRF